MMLPSSTNVMDVPVCSRRRLAGASAVPFSDVMTTYGATVSTALSVSVARL